MPQDLKIDYLELPARDFEAVQAFYEKAFGWTFTDYGEEYRAFNDGKLDGGFYRTDKASSTDSGAALIILYANDLEKTRDKILASGGRLVQDIFAFPGGRRFHLPIQMATNWPYGQTKVFKNKFIAIASIVFVFYPDAYLTTGTWFELSGGVLVSRKA